MLTLYGIPNCDTVRKARKWLDEHKIDYRFHDYKISGVKAEVIHEWLKQTSLETIFNKRSTTFKELSISDQKKSSKPEYAISLMMKHTSIIKRPVLVHPRGLLTGFKETDWSAALLSSGKKI